MPDLNDGWEYDRQSAEHTWHNLDDKQALQRAALIGRELRSEREARGWSLDHVSMLTKIGVSALAAIEKGELHRLPGNREDDWGLNVYVKGFIRTYARCLNIKHDPLTLFARQSGQPVYIDTNVVLAAVSIPKEKLTRPPKFAEYLLYLFLTRRERVHLIGDLTEEYVEVLHKFGVRKAKFWFYQQVFYSLQPLIWRSLSKLRMVAEILELLSRWKNQ